MDETVEAVNKAVNELANECFKQREGEIPLLISENDICCGLVEKLKKRVSYRVTTEFCLGNKKRNDIIIFSSESEQGNYKKSRDGNPSSFLIKRPITLIELKINWSGQKPRVLKELKEDVEYLADFITLKFKNLDKNPKFKYVIYFDYNGVLDKGEIDSFSKNGSVMIYYVDLKQKEIHQTSSFLAVQ